MKQYLEDIVSDVRRRLEERKKAVPLDKLVTGRPGERPSFMEAMRQPGLSLIGEIKRASPSRGLLRESIDASDLAQRYERAGARAISVLTEKDHFRGGPEDLREAASATSLPVLEKDFIVDDYQVFEARGLGASAVLLIAALLSDEELPRLVQTAADAGVEALVEVHDEAELERALDLDGVVIGINNRNLRSFEVSLDTTFRLICLVPPEVVVVSESGVRTREDFKRLESAGVDGVLIGESIVTAEDVETAIRGLLADAE